MQNKAVKPEKKNSDKSFAQTLRKLREPLEYFRVY